MVATRRQQERCRDATFSEVAKKSVHGRKRYYFLYVGVNSEKCGHFSLIAGNWLRGRCGEEQVFGSLDFVPGLTAWDRLYYSPHVERIAYPVIANDSAKLQAHPVTFIVAACDDTVSVLGFSHDTVHDF